MEHPSCHPWEAAGPQHTSLRCPPWCGCPRGTQDAWILLLSPGFPVTELQQLQRTCTLVLATQAKVSFANLSFFKISLPAVLAEGLAQPGALFGCC